MLIRKARTAVVGAHRYGRFLLGLRGFLRRRMTLDEAESILRERIANRGRNFLTMVEGAVFSYPRSPYRALFESAGCAFADVERGVTRDGLEPTLVALRDAGVYVTFNEFWAQGPIVRNGHEIPVRWSSFDNPFLSATYRMSTGGSSGRPRSVEVDVEHLWARVPQQLVTDTIQGFAGAPTALWFDGLPGNAPNTMLTRVPTNTVAERWFTPTALRDARPLLDFNAQRYRWTEASMLAMARLYGARVPRPEPITLEQADVIARWAADTLAHHGRCGVKTMVSRAVRVSLAAGEMGLDLNGLTMSGGGEPPTPAKVAAVERSGARFLCNYHFQEAGAIGKQCMNPLDENDQHLMKDHLAMITRPRQVPGFEETVDAFCFTTLLPTARKLMINVETDDYGIVEERDCGCPWEAFGLKTHLRGIRSFRKLTGEGVTLVGNELVKIIEDVLPGRFGGSPLDYQFVEEEDEDSLTRMSLVVSPRVDVVDEAELVEVVLDHAIQGGARALWRQAETLRVLRREPTWTERGKLMPLHLDRHLAQRRDAKHLGGSHAPPSEPSS